jgi:hypothetical protein
MATTNTNDFFRHSRAADRVPNDADNRPTAVTEDGQPRGIVFDTSTQRVQVVAAGDFNADGTIDAAEHVAARTAGPGPGEPTGIIMANTEGDFHFRATAPNSLTVGGRGGNDALTSQVTHDRDFEDWAQPAALDLDDPGLSTLFPPNLAEVDAHVTFITPDPGLLTTTATEGFDPSDDGIQELVDLPD